MPVICVLRGVGFILLISLQETLTSLSDLVCDYCNFDILKVLPFVTFIHLMIVIPLLLLKGPNTYLRIMYTEPWMELSHFACWKVSHFAEKIFIFCGC